MRYGFRIVVLLFFISVQLAGMISALALPVYISGRAVTARDQQPATGATIGLYSVDTTYPQTQGEQRPVDTTTVLTNGSFLLKAPASGHYVLRMEEAQRLFKDQEITVSASGESGLKLEFVRLPALRLLITDPAGKLAAIQKAAVWCSIHWQDDTYDMPVVIATTTAQGGMEIMADHRIPAVVIQDIDLFVRLEDVGWAEVQIPDWTKDPVPIQLKAGGFIKGIVVDGQGKPRAHVPVFVSRLPKHGYDPILSGRARTVTGDDGTYLLKALAPGDYLVMSITAAGPRGCIVTVKADPGVK